MAAGSSTDVPPNFITTRFIGIVLKTGVRDQGSGIMQVTPDP
jgi:hypothetical protein